MKVLRIKAFQETACYKKPFANKVAETYPLPPYSTVKGLIHAILNADELIPFSLSIQGDFETQIIDYRTMYFVKKRQFAMPIVLDGLATETPKYSTNVMTSMPLYTHLLYNIQLVFHVRAEETILDDIYHAFYNIDAFPSLGRHEDLIRIDAIDYVYLEETDELNTKHSIYIPKAVCDEDRLGVPYLLNWTYTVKKGIREWTKIPSLYVMKNTNINEEEVNRALLMDEEGYAVFWNE
ncbi:MAG TPA: type I-B CRISPR-associated protein Cas5b [Bacillota bacterium]|nr:type I-B CRISPR-associated protein Cas5b [Bacillota bacterium]